MNSESRVRNEKFKHIPVLLLLSLLALMRVPHSLAQAPKFEALNGGIVKVQTHRNTKPDDWPETFDWSADELGTGLIVADNSGVFRILTAAHVIQGASKVTVSLSSDVGIVATARVLTVVDVLDIALLEVRFPNQSRALDSLAPYRYPADHAVKQSMQIWTENWHLEPVPNNVVRLDFSADTRRFVYTANSIGEGYSGGPVFDHEGRLVGVHVLSHDESRTYKVMVAIKIDAALGALDSLGFSVTSLNKLTVGGDDDTASSLSGSPIERLKALGLKYDNDSFSEAVRNGEMPAVKAYLDAGMSPQGFYNASDRYILGLPLFAGTENFPDILAEFQKHKLNLAAVNPKSSSAWFYADGPETMQDQFWLILATSNKTAAAIQNGKALLAAGASPARALKSAQTCKSGWHCREMIEYLGKIGYRGAASEAPASSGPVATGSVVVANSGNAMTGAQLFKAERFVEAPPLLEKSANSGDGEAAGMLGTYYQLGIVRTPIDTRQSFSWYQKGAQAGDPYSMLLLGDLYFSGLPWLTIDQGKALTLFHKSAEKGNARAMTNLGFAYFAGTGVQDDDLAAAAWFRRAAAGGDTEGMAALHDLIMESSQSSYLYRVFLVANLFRKAVVNNDRQIYNQLGQIFQSGSNGVRANPARASRFFTAARTGKL